MFASSLPQSICFASTAAIPPHSPPTIALLFCLLLSRVTLLLLQSRVTPPSSGTTIANYSQRARTISYNICLSISKHNTLLFTPLSRLPRWRRRWWEIPRINQTQRTLLPKQNHLITRPNMYQLHPIIGTTLDGQLLQHFKCI